MTKQTSDYICTRTLTKADYDHEWYCANRTYKRLCSRLRYRAFRDHAKDFFECQTALRVIQDDRRELVARGKWLDERDGTEYMGITPRTYVQLTLDLGLGD